MADGQADAGKSGSPPPADTPPQKPAVPAPGAVGFQIALLVLLLALAGWLGASRRERVQIDWHLGDLRRTLDDPGARAYFARVGDRALPYLEKELASRDLNARVIAVLALDAIDTPASTLMLASASKNDDLPTSSNAIIGLTRRGGKVATDALVEALGDKRMIVRVSARRAMAARSKLAWWMFGRPGTV